MMSKREEKSFIKQIAPVIIYSIWVMYRFMDTSVPFLLWMAQSSFGFLVTIILTIILTVKTSYRDEKEKEASLNKSAEIFKRYAVFHNVDMRSIRLFPCIYNDKDTNIALSNASELWLDRDGKCYTVSFKGINMKYSCDQRDFTETKRDGVVGRAVIGGIIAGIPGAIIGGATSKSTSRT